MKLKQSKATVQRNHPWIIFLGSGEMSFVKVCLSALPLNHNNRVSFSHGASKGIMPAWNMLGHYSSVWRSIRCLAPSCHVLLILFICNIYTSPFAEQKTLPQGDLQWILKNTKPLTIQSIKKWPHKTIPLKIPVHHENLSKSKQGETLGRVNAV